MFLEKCEFSFTFFAAYIFAIIYQLCLANNKSILLKHFFIISIGLSICLFNFGMVFGIFRNFQLKIFFSPPRYRYYSFVDNMFNNLLFDSFIWPNAFDGYFKFYFLYGKLAIIAIFDYSISNRMIFHFCFSHIYYMDIMINI